MDAIVLAGGFAKRMWPLTKDRPKQLLPVAGQPMLTFVLEAVEAVAAIDRIIVSTNEAFKSQFEAFIEKYDSRLPLELVCEPTMAEDHKLGSIGALGWLIDQKQLANETLIVGGDNLFEFSLNDTVAFYRAKDSEVIVCYDIDDPELAKPYSVVELDGDDRVLSFIEKPTEPRTSLVAIACYVFSANGMAMIRKYLDEGGNPDAMGHLIEWLHVQTSVYGFTFHGRWFDIGSLEVYKQADEYFSSKA